MLPSVVKVCLQQPQNEENSQEKEEEDEGVYHLLAHAQSLHQALVRGMVLDAAPGRPDQLGQAGAVAWAARPLAVNVFFYFFYFIQHFYIIFILLF
jgi:hypothetical protein